MNNNNTVWQSAKITKDQRSQLMGHQSCVIWFTGFSASGKSTIAMELESRLYEKGIHTYVLDGDNLRQGLNRNLGFSPEDRKENIRRVGEVSKLFADAGTVVLSAFITPYQSDRDMVRGMFSSNEFIEVYVKCSIEECERRDPKGLYKKARSGEISDFTGISAPYELPESPEITLETDILSLSDCVEKVVDYLYMHKYIACKPN